MNNRITTVIVITMLVTLTSGCRGTMGSFWFGRGARCGLCNQTPVPQFGNVMQAPQQAPPGPGCGPRPSCISKPWQKPYQQPCQGAPYQQAPAGDCGCNNYVTPPGGDTCGGTCGQAPYSSAYGDCGCGNVVNEQGGIVNDPYLSGGVPFQGGSNSIQSQPYPGQVIDGEVVVSPGQVIDGQMVPGTSVPGPNDNWQPRNYPQGTVPQGTGSTGTFAPQNYQSQKFDTDGKKILWEEPLPTTGTQL